MMHSIRKVESSSSPKGNKALHALLSWRREESVMFQAVQACWKKIRCQPSRAACHTTLQRASYPPPSRSDGLALSHSSKCHSRGSWHAATCLRLALCMCLLVLKQQFSLLFCCFLYFAKSKTFLSHTQTHTKTCTWLAWFTDLIL